MDTLTAEQITELCQALKDVYEYDLSGYNRASLSRRIGHFMHKYSITRFSDLREFLLTDRQSFFNFLQSLLVITTEMFRDLDVFQFIYQEILPHLATYPSIKIWHAGCSTGQEAYSMAILLHQAGLLDRSIIYGTDIHFASLQQARAGIYPLEDMQGYEQAYSQLQLATPLREYYSVSKGWARMHDFLSRKILFTEHNLAGDGVFSEVQMVFCRNVMIYFDAELESRVLKLFHDSLCPSGFLCIGRLERIIQPCWQREFSEYDPIRRIYRRPLNIESGERLVLRRKRD